MEPLGLCTVDYGESTEGTEKIATKTLRKISTNQGGFLRTNLGNRLYDLY